MELRFYQYLGTTYTQASGYPEESWTAYQNPQTPAQTSTWYTTNDATYELTGVQLETGSTANDFAHESYGETLSKCQRYYYEAVEGNGKVLTMGTVTSANEVVGVIPFPVSMRAAPSIDVGYGSDYWRIAGGNLGGDKYISATWIIFNETTARAGIYADPDSDLGSYLGESGYVGARNASAKLAFSAEL